MLDTRLKMIYGLLPKSELICDVGTDHCKLAAYAVKQGRARRAAATDLRRGPLDAALKTVEANGLSDRIELVLSDGFLDIPDRIFNSADCFVIAGMGGELIESILRGRHTDKLLVLQPMSAVYELCAYLCENGYEIIKRVFCRDGDKIYTAILCQYNGKQREFSPFEGAVRDKNFYLFLEKELNRIDKALSGMSRGVNVDDIRRRELEGLKKIIISEKSSEN